MKNILKIVPAFAFIIIFSACQKKDDACTNPTLNVQGLEKFNTCTQPSIIEAEVPEGDFVIVRSQDAFEKLLSPSQCFKVDFSKNDVVIGKKQLTSNLVSTAYTLTQDCNTNNLMLKVVFTKGVATVAPIVIYSAVIPKLQGEQTVSVITE